MKRALRYIIPALAALLIGTAQAVTTTNLLVNFEGSLAGTVYTLGAGEIDTTGTFAANGTPTLTDYSGEIHAGIDPSAYADANADGFFFDPTSLGDLTATYWVAEAVVAFNTISGGQQTVIDVHGNTDFRIHNDGSVLQAGYWDGSSFGDVTSDLPAILTFVHLALVWDGSDTSLTAYTNGVSIGTVDNNAFTTSSSISFGYLNAGVNTGRAIDGLLHAVSFATSDTALTDADFLINSLPADPPVPTGPPVWIAPDLDGGSVVVGATYSNTLAGVAEDPDGDEITYFHAGGPSWLNVATNGIITGVPAPGDIGTNVFTVGATDNNSGTNNATLNIVVNPATGPVITWEATATPITDEVDVINDGDDAPNLTYEWDIWPSGTRSTNSASGTADFGSGGTVNGVVFAGAGGNSDYWTSLGGTSTGDSTLDAILGSHEAFGNASDPWVMVITGLAENTDYKIQIIGIHDLRGGGVSDRTTSYIDIGGGSASPTLTRGTGESVIGTFSTGSGETTLTFEGIGASDPGAAAIVIRKIGLPPGDAVTVSINGPVGGAGMVLSWSSQAGYTYSVQTNSNLIVANWADWRTSIAGDGGSISVTNTIGPDQVFYRVMTHNQ